MSRADRDRPRGLLGDEALETSSVVANSAMKRLRGSMVDTRRRRVTVAGRRHVALAYRYLGANARAGANTRQPGFHQSYEVTVGGVSPEEEPPPAR